MMAKKIGFQRGIQCCLLVVARLYFARSVVRSGCNGCSLYCKNLLNFFCLSIILEMMLKFDICRSA